MSDLIKTVAPDPDVRSATEIGIQMLGIADTIRTDVAAAMRSCRDVGYAFAELTIDYCPPDPTVVAEAAIAEHFPVTALHVSFGQLAKPLGLRDAIMYAKAIRAGRLICSGVASGDVPDALQRSIATYTTVGQHCLAEGMTFYFHPYSWDFDRVGNLTFLQHVVQDTDPNLVRINLDTFWLHRANQDFLTTLQWLGARCDYFHLKDGTSRKQAAAPYTYTPLGKGAVPIRECVSAIRTLCRRPVLVVEQDTHQSDPLPDLRESLRFLNLDQ